MCVCVFHPALHLTLVTHEIRPAGETPHIPRTENWKTVFQPKAETGVLNNVKEKTPFSRALLSHLPEVFSRNSLPGSHKCEVHCVVVMFQRNHFPPAFPLSVIHVENERKRPWVLQGKETLESTRSCWICSVNVLEQQRKKAFPFLAVHRKATCTT